MLKVYLEKIFKVIWTLNKCLERLLQAHSNKFLVAQVLPRMIKFRKEVFTAWVVIIILKRLPDHLLCQLYQSFVLPIFDYCDAVWAVTLSSISKPLERLHSRFLQGISTCSSFIKFTLMERRRFHTAVQVFKVVNKLCPSYLRDWFINAEAYTGWRVLID